MLSGKYLTGSNDNRWCLLMILCDQSEIDGYTKEGVWGQATLDALFRKNVRSHGDQIALSDPPNRENFTCGAARRLTYGEADEIIDDLSAMFRMLKLDRDDVVAVQLPNTVELPLLILACFRAGLIISILPTSWRQAELEQALNKILPKVLITQYIAGDVNFPDLMRETTVNVPSIRHILAFGDDVPDGIVAVDKAISFARENDDFIFDAADNSGSASANDVAIISWNGAVSPDLKPIPRTHNHLISAGLTVLLEASLENQGSLLCPFSFSGLAALGVFFVPWILTGSSLHLHQPFDRICFMQQIRLEKPTFTGLPAAALTGLGGGVKKGNLDISSLKAMACLWPTFGSRNSSANIDASLLPPIIDIVSISEMALFSLRRSDNPAINFIPHGECKFPSFTEGAPSLITTRLKGCVMRNGSAGTMLVGQLMIKGPMVCAGLFTPKTADGEELAPLEADGHGFIATGVKCEIVDEGGPKLKPVDRLNNIIYHGGLAVAAEDLDVIYSEFSGVEHAVAVSVPDPILGERIAAAIVPGSETGFSYDDFKSFLENRQLAPYKIPCRVIEVKEIPVDDEGVVVRQAIET